MIEVNDIRINNCNISFNIFDNTSYVIYNKDSDFVKKFLMLLSGINGSIKKKTSKIIFNKQNVFDNKDYFEKRIFLDFNEKYLSTLTPSYIKDSSKHRYDLDIDPKVFKKYIDDLEVRKYTKVTNKYIFTDEANSFVNYAFLRSSLKKRVIVHDVLAKVDNEEKIKYIVDDLFKSSYESIIVSTDNLQWFIDKEIKIILFDEYKGYIINPKEDVLLISDFEIPNKSIIMKTNEYYIYYNDIDKDKLKEIKKDQGKIKIGNIRDVYKYIKKEAK